MRRLELRRMVLAVMLALGTVSGFGAGFAAMHGHHRHHRDALERHVAEVCVRAADRARDEAE